jgi:putative ABC transport system permease protein
VILAFRDLLLKYQRFLATSMGVGLLLGVVLIQAGIYRGIVADAFDLTEIFGTDMWVVQPDHFGPFTESSLIATGTRDLIKRVPGVRSAEAITVSQGLAQVGGIPKRVDVVGYDIYRMPFPAELVAGRAPSKPRYEVAIDSGVGAALGERISVRGRILTVVGITGRAVGISGNPIVFMTLLDSRDFNEKQGPAEIRRLRAAGGNPGVPDQVNAVRVQVQPGADVLDVRREIEQWKHFQVISKPDQEANILRNIGRLRMTLLLFASILVLAATAIIALTIYSLTTDKVREIATLKLIGAGNRVITGLVLWQAVAIGLSGYIGGNLFLYSVRDVFPGYLELRVSDNLGIGVIAISACLVASIGAVRLALRIEPHQALGG